MKVKQKYRKIKKDKWAWKMITDESWDSEEHKWTISLYGNRFEAKVFPIVVHKQNKL